MVVGAGRGLGLVGHRLGRSGGGKWEPLSAAHWFGTNIIGQDIFDRAMYSTQHLVRGGPGGGGAGDALGGVLGALAGFFSGSLIDELIIWLMGVLDSIPFYLLVAAIAFACRTRPTRCTSR